MSDGRLSRGAECARRAGECIHRREFLERTARAFLGASLPMAIVPVAAAGCASLVTRTVTPIDGTLRLALAHYPELIAEGGSLRLQPAGFPDPLYVLVLGDRRYAALSPICTHLGCTVEIEQARLVCPCHGSSYDREGRVTRGPAEEPLTRYRAQLTSDGVLVIDLRSTIDA